MLRSLYRLNEKKVVIKRRLENGVETVASPFPCLVTVHSSAAECRPRNAKQLMKYKYARTSLEMDETPDYIKELVQKREYLNISIWTVDDIHADEIWLGLSGSPTKVKNIENIVLQAKESKVLTDADEDINAFIRELIDNHTIG
jgi:electron transfer flavoprotein beta subunit